MRLWFKSKDGGNESSVTGYWLVEAKRLLSIALLRFDGDSREAFHTHAFHCLGWVLRGELKEEMLDGRVYRHKPSILPFFVGRRDFHKVSSIPARTWVFTIRGPWLKRWQEYLPVEGRGRDLESGRKEVASWQAPH